MTRPPQSELKKSLDFWSHLLNEKTPRALIVIGAARIEEEIKMLAEQVAPGSEDIRKTHGSRITLLTNAGVLSEDTTFCLRKLGVIRNHFAHTSASVSLADTAISGDVAELFDRLEPHTSLADFAPKVFEAYLAKAPATLHPSTWVDEGWQKMQAAMLLLLNHLIVVRHNLPPQPKPIEIWDYDFK